jgi:hypothetical protein
MTPKDILLQQLNNADDPLIIETIDWLRSLRGCLRSKDDAPNRPLHPPFWGTVKQIWLGSPPNWGVKPFGHTRKGGECKNLRPFSDILLAYRRWRGDRWGGAMAQGEGRSDSCSGETSD